MMLPIIGRLEMTESVLNVDISIDADGWRDVIPRLELTVRLAAEETVKVSGYGGTKAEISVLMTDNCTIAGLNENWRGKPDSTNVLAFPGELEGPGPVLLGDIVLAIETIIAEANADGIKLSDHISHLVIHGVLHLLGHDHVTEYEAVKMEGLETKILKTLGISNPYQDSRMKFSEINT